METNVITREIRIEADPTVVYEVVSSPEHIAQWWGADAEFSPQAGAAGVLHFRNPDGSLRAAVQLSVLEASPFERFAFQWDYPEGEAPGPSNATTVTFELSAHTGGTVLRVTEVGFLERAWPGRTAAEAIEQHEDGWSRHLGTLKTYAEGLGAR